MRLLEAAMLAALVPAVAGLFFARSRRPRWLAYTPLAALLFAVLHLLLERYRWQMVPAYVLAAGLILLTSTNTAARSPASRPSWRRVVLRIAGALLVLLTFAIAVALPLLFPVFEMPRPTGPHGVGTTRMRFVDESRPETFTPDVHDHRDLMVQVWYPGMPAPGAKPESLWHSVAVIGPRLATALRLPRFLFDHLALVESHSYSQAPLAPDHLAYPVLIFSHGYAQGFVAQNEVQMEELASHGYVVFSIGHPYESAAVVYPDGRTVAMDGTQTRKVADELGAALPPVLEKLQASKDKAERLALTRELIGGAPTLTNSLGIWAADTSFVLDQLEAMNEGRTETPFRGRLDMARVGVFGMSFGGTAAGQVCLLDSRVKAGLNLDGLQYGDLLDRPLQRPFLFMNSENGRGLNEPMYERAESPAYYLTVKGSRHFDFSDFPLISPLFKKLGVVGTVDAVRMLRIYNAYTLAFFDTYVKGEASPLLDGPSPSYPEVEFQARQVHARQRASKVHEFRSLLRR